MKKKLYKVITSILILIVIFNQSIVAEQTLGELQNEIDKIKEETEKQLAEKEKIEEEKISTETDIAEVKEEIDTVTANIEQKQQEIEEKKYEIEIQNGKIEEIKEKIPKVKMEADRALRFLQKASNSNLMIEMILAPSTDEADNILRRINSVNTIAEYTGDTILELVEIERQLEYEKTILERDESELEAAQIELQNEQNTLNSKEEKLEEVLKNQSDASAELDTSIEEAAEDQAMMEDTLAYYESFGCSADDVVGSNCGGLGDDDNDGVINNDDVCPNEYGTQPNGCPAPDVDEGGNSGGGNSGGGGSSSTFSRPLSTGVVTCDWGCYGGHTGMDMDNRDYDSILAVADGVVITARSGCAPFYSGVNACNGGYGNYVMLMHNTSDGIVFSLYGHMASLSVSQGQSVKRGQELGLLGDSGNSQGSHLHLEVYPDANGNGLPDDYKSNPRNYISFPALGVWW